MSAVAVLQARALGVSAAVAATAASTTVMPLQAANFVHLLTYSIFLVSLGWDSDSSSSSSRIAMSSWHSHSIPQQMRSGTVL